MKFQVIITENKGYYEVIVLPDGDKLYWGTDKGMAEFIYKTQKSLIEGYDDSF